MQFFFTGDNWNVAFGVGAFVPFLLEIFSPEMQATLGICWHSIDKLWTERQIVNWETNCETNCELRDKLWDKLWTERQIVRQIVNWETNCETNCELRDKLLDKLWTERQIVRQIVNWETNC